jgi:hypothetical protein
MMRPLAIFGAFAAALIMFFVAMEFAIGGWETPYSLSFPLFLAYPLIMVALTREEGDAGWAGIVLLLLLLPADIALYRGCYGHCRSILASPSELPGLWFSGWALLHILANAALIRWIVYRRDMRHRAED